VVKHGSGVVQDQSIYLSYTDNDLEGVAQRVGSRDESCDHEAHGAPGELRGRVVSS
jgi:hypothetical protein